MSKSANESNNIIFLDEIFGIRAFGLIFYGVLPSILFLIGVLEVKIYNTIESAQFFIIIPIIPIAIFIFSLIRNRLKGFYLTTDFLNIRSIMITAITLLISTVIFGLSGVIQGKYVFVIPHNWNESMDLLKSGPNFEPFLLAIASLLIASTLFFTVVTKEVNLPALPPVKFVKLIIEVQDNMKLLKSNPIWNECVSMEDDKLINLANKIEYLLDQAINIKISFDLQNSLKPVHDDITNFIKVLKYVKCSANEKLKKETWEIYFANIISLSPDQKMRRERDNEICNSINSIKRLKLED
ncbi:MAG: hypothetical protein HF976_05755 [ANME-2 cluster archaeon]|nr:hypothetical protein [ANME-2 cluster archaeon]MBC2700908.1 hypothetical protein [ANME-2 cluster archaeon]MBC2709251.1 hypothetical protein [ANME-2 cluster archaeon]MBC2745438.1 hypothetical protein [ANME-2 cluster archaeon]